MSEDRHIRIVFTTSNAWYSRLIRFITRSKVSHVLVSFPDVTLRKVVAMQANPTGYEVEPWKRTIATRKLVKMFRCDIDLGEAVAELADWLGTRYNYSGVLGALVQMIFALFGRRIRNPFNDARKLFCSEAVVMLLQYAKVPASEKMVPASTSPEMLLEFCNESPRIHEVEEVA